MKQNRSLAISSKIQECKMGNIIGPVSYTHLTLPTNREV